MAMVRGSYAPVYRHKSFEFGEARVADGRIAQRVRIVDAEGVPWEALYTLEQQADGSLKITRLHAAESGSGGVTARRRNQHRRQPANIRPEFAPRSFGIATSRGLRLTRRE